MYLGCMRVDYQALIVVHYPSYFKLMDRMSLKAQERTVLGKKVKRLRKDGIIPGHVFGNTDEVEHVQINTKDFQAVLNQAGETGLIDLRIGEEKIRPVLIRETDFDPRNGDLIHVGFYQVNLKEKVTVPVPIVLIGDEHESVKMGENVVLQNLSEVQVEALPTDLIENIEVNIEVLQNVDDAITVGQLNYDRDKLTVLADPEEVVVKLAPAVTEEMKALLEEQEAEVQAAAEEAGAEEGDASAEAGGGEEGEETAESEAVAEETSGSEDKTE
jgi:large subunit ribosomal protein L25